LDVVLRRLAVRLERGSRLSRDKDWPELPYEAWKDTYATLQLWAQVVGKIKLKLCPFVNHWWQVAFHITPRGLRTGPMHYGNALIEIEFDFIDHVLAIFSSDGRRRILALAPRSVADFYRETMDCLGSLGVRVAIDREPKELPDVTPFDQDTKHASYDREYAERHWRILVQCDRLFNQFRGGFIGKSSPVHFFWGSFDLPVTRFSGRLAPPRPEADHITRVAYSHEVISCGFWPGSGNILEPAFYAYASPEPEGYSSARVAPREAFYNPPTHGFILRYEDVRRSADPDRTVLEFCQSTYDVAADLGKWDRKALERKAFPWAKRARAA
jgi:hypothetical protein